VRDPKLADIHILVTEQRTASNATEYGMNFLGLSNYSDIQYKLTTISPQNESNILKWERLLKTVNAGLLPYISRTPEIDNINIKYEGINIKTKQEINDPFNFWVYRLRLGTEYEGEESQNEYSIRSSFQADRINERLKFKSKLSYETKKEIYKDGDDEIKSSREETEFNADIVYSLNPRWSVGFFNDFSTSSFLNLSLSSVLGPAIEYNIFPWDKSDRKVFVIAYHINTNYYKYDELTIFNKKEEFRTSQALRLSLILRQPWGEIENTLEGSHYFFDLSKNRLTLESEISLNIAKGLAIFFEYEVELIHDQLYLSSQGATREEILLNQKKLATNFDMKGELGVRFTFGSIYNNVVNQRFKY
jgi:hypothetical protein